MYRWVDHTGELEIEIEAPTVGEVFEHGFEAMRELLAGDAADLLPTVRRELSVTAPDRAALLAEWLAELAFLAESEGLVPERLSALELGERSLRAVVEGRHARPPHLVKAVTYHRLSVEPGGDGWRATVVLDV
jgi:SHS2 domain-containing protein